MLTSRRIGGLPGLSWLWDGSPFRAALVVLVADYGIMSLLMLLEGLPPWQRTQYTTVLWNDTLFYPLYAAMAVVVMRGAGPLRDFYCSRTWHTGLLTAGFAVSLALECIGVTVGQYTMSQELSPSKLWHTFIFGIMFYWLIGSLIPVTAVRRPRWAMVVVGACLVGAVAAMYVELVSPIPWNTHLEGSYFPWEWHVRPISGVGR